MKYNIAISGKKLTEALIKLDAKVPVKESKGISWAHFWHKSNLSFETIEKQLLQSDNISWFLSDSSKKSTSEPDFPSRMRVLEQTLLECRVSALLNASFLEPGSLYVFDDYVSDSGSKSGRAYGREFFFDSDNPIILEMKRLKAIRPENTKIFLTELTMAFRETPSENALPLLKQIATNIETLGNWYFINSPLPFQETRGELLKYQRGWSQKADERSPILYLSRG